MRAPAVSPVRLWACAPCGRTYVAVGERCAACGGPTVDATGDGRGRLSSWTTVYAVAGGGDPYVLGWAELDGAGIGVIGRFADADAGRLRRGLAVLVRQEDGGDAWPRLWLEPDR
ncbi:MAG TPA: OB-fold domain-containing protein [Acidimicrobiia bacterium]|jgi:uncharacterized OB-fold protein|nr:OB-fold domain-containing protein [Acidimicrobiia bacterium]